MLLLLGEANADSPIVWCSFNLQKSVPEYNAIGVGH